MAWQATVGERGSRPGRSAVWAALLLGGLVLFLLLAPVWLRSVPDWLVLPLPEWLGGGLTWLAREASIGGLAVQQITRGLAELVNQPIEAAQVLLADGIMTGRGLDKRQAVPPLPWLGLVGMTVILGYRLGGLKLAATVAVAGPYLVVFGLWHDAMVTLSSVLLCVVIAAGLGLALGVLSYRRAGVALVARGTMNVMQTVPIFAYLVPTLLFFGYGPAAAVLATVIYALPPMVHTTVLALRSVPQETVEYGRMAGCTRRQLLWQVQLPVALPTLAVGLNQVIMMSLNMVIIASMIGAGGLGYKVLQALRKLDIGSGLQAGLGIVALAVILDRLSQAGGRKLAAGKQAGKKVRVGWLMLAWLLISIVIGLLATPLSAWPKDWIVTTAGFWNGLVTAINQNLYEVLQGIRTFALLYVMKPLRDFLLAVPWSLLVVAAGLAGALLGGRRLGLTAAALLLFVALSGYWEAAMQSVYLVLLAVATAIAIGFPIGFWLAARPRLQPGAGLILDTLQTLPTFVYLLPAVMLFRIGDVAALIAITSYAIAPAIRYALHGIRQVPAPRLEAAAMTGCTRRQSLYWVKLPAAFPSLVLGVNQTVMMALSMLIIAALVGTNDLGQEILTALNRAEVGQGIVAGLCVAALALVADGLLKALAARAGRQGGAAS
ncbi:MAG: ABC transporter permease subunit [Rhodospirillales bacterium]